MSRTVFLEDACLIEHDHWLHPLEVLALPIVHLRRKATLPVAAPQRLVPLHNGGRVVKGERK